MMVITETRAQPGRGPGFGSQHAATAAISPCKKSARANLPCHSLFLRLEATRHDKPPEATAKPRPNTAPRTPRLHAAQANPSCTKTGSRPRAVEDPGPGKTSIRPPSFVKFRQHLWHHPSRGLPPQAGSRVIKIRLGGRPLKGTSTTRLGHHSQSSLFV